MTESVGGAGGAGAPPEFIAAIKEFGLELDARDLAVLDRYLDLLYEANERMNLTGVRDRNAAWMRHIFDALTLFPTLAQTEARSVVDVGSGGGIPGLILATVMPTVQFTLVESTGKKAKFLQETAKQMSLENVRVLAQRAEALGAKELRECIDVVVSRAVARLPILLELCLPMVRPGGFFIAIKGEQAAAEVATSAHALGELRGVVVDQLRTPTGTLVIVEKRGKCPNRYPRTAGEPERAPL
ncbi:MAG: 16S rRNA (guanine(527)-N(7))-methyltransferase RsmG [Phycisphaerales bacterium]|nr:16S rRNA (guanine(527)-N(7))-methyltransferase RsmG [Phycisphaerales bacterium]